MAVTLLSNLLTPALAYNSTGSTTDQTTGEDKVQKVVTEYYGENELQNPSNANTEVYATRSSTFTVLIPKTIILDGINGDAQYVVGAKGDVLAEDSITIEPDTDTITLLKVGTTDVTVDATITQNKDPITGAQIEAAGGNTYVTRNGSIQANGLKAGSWQSTVTFNIVLNETNVPETIEYEAFTVDASNRDKVGYTEDKTELVIDPTFYDDDTGKWYKVTAIGNLAFTDCNNLVSVTIPEGVTSIDTDAFYSCSNLETIEVSPNNPNYNSVDGVLFNKDQTILVQYPQGKAGGYTIPETVTEIGQGAFADCTKLTLVIIPDTVKIINAGAFQHCIGLTEVKVPTEIEFVGNYAFWNVPKVIYNGTLDTSEWRPAEIVTS